MVILDAMEGCDRGYPVFPLRLDLAATDVQICRTAVWWQELKVTLDPVTPQRRRPELAGKALSLRSLTFRPFRTLFYKGILKFVAVSGKWFHITPSRSSVLHTVLSLLLNDFLLRRPIFPPRLGNVGIWSVSVVVSRPAFQLSLQAPHPLIALKFRFRFC